MEKTVAQKLEGLIQLQNIDSKIQEIKKILGALPEEVADLEDEIVGYETRINKLQADIDDTDQKISNYRQAIKDSEALILKYKDQQMNVRNNREYDAITKEIELQELEIQISEKRTREANQTIETMKSRIDETAAHKSEREKDLTSKKKELEEILAESKEEQERLAKERDAAFAQVEERLGKSYDRIRLNARNGLAVVAVERDACGGCFAVVPPQRQADIRDRKKLIVCEHCGRILASVTDIPVVEEEKPKRTTRRATTRRTKKDA
ncbi:zinc ribbon domain-containing protein [Persicobacter psychrovividus]|uniref:C4-type zinc ribbon domain-containing protein n=1 Tax=Persicobacter psychrovividus TaxID=387638 RepID=A0ABM7VF05_9BACT|nr:hypothetical protein PEPS_17700 [Persicobacter psychrovividus]